MRFKEQRQHTKKIKKAERQAEKERLKKEEKDLCDSVMWREQKRKSK